VLEVPCFRAKFHHFAPRAAHTWCQTMVLCGSQPIDIEISKHPLELDVSTFQLVNFWIHQMSSDAWMRHSFKQATRATRVWSSFKFCDDKLESAGARGRCGASTSHLQRPRLGIYPRLSRPVADAAATSGEHKALYDTHADRYNCGRLSTLTRCHGDYCTSPRSGTAAADPSA